MFRRAIERLGLVGVIKTDAHLQAQALSQAVGQEIHKVLGEQRELEVKFEELRLRHHADLAELFEVRQEMPEAVYVRLSNSLKRRLGE